VGYNKNGEIITGIYAQRSHNIIELNSCEIQLPVSQEIAKFIIEFMKKNKILPYNEITRKGTIRHIVVKVGIYTNEIMCVLVTNEKKIPKEKELVNALIENFNNIKTIVKNINSKNTNVIMGQENENLYGEGFIQDKLGNFTFNISPLSFYQINPVQTEKLYNLAITKANLKKDDIVLDLYCGIGTIGIFASTYVKKVYGIEIIEQAIANAKENAKINNIDNISFYCGDVERVLEDVLNKEKVKPNVVFVDPPRKGLDMNTIQNIVNLKPEKLVYISCNPATLVRDLKELEKIYSIKEIQPVDMFPFTSHVECCSVLYLKDSIQ
jgi:23S rRNA (uracil1939-C5)-methyltransferase